MLKISWNAGLRGLWNEPRDCVVIFAQAGLDLLQTTWLWQKPEQNADQPLRHINRSLKCRHGKQVEITIGEEVTKLFLSYYHTSYPLLQKLTGLVPRMLLSRALWHPLKISTARTAFSQRSCKTCKNFTETIKNERKKIHVMMNFGKITEISNKLCKHHRTVKNSMSMFQWFSKIWWIFQLIVKNTDFPIFNHFFSREQYLFNVFEVIVSTLESKLQRIENLDKAVEHLMRRVEALDSRVNDNIDKTDAVITKLRTLDLKLFHAHPPPPPDYVDPQSRAADSRSGNSDEGKRKWSS